MRYKQKVKAFTILEIIVALILSFFVLGMLYLSYNIMLQQMQNNNETKFSELLLLKTEFESKFFQADIVTNYNETLIFEFQDKKVIVRFEDKVIIREQLELTDTIFSGNYTWQIIGQDENGWISKLILVIMQGENEQQLAFDKTYFPNLVLREKELNFEY